MYVVGASLGVRWKAYWVGQIWCGFGFNLRSEFQVCQSKSANN